MSFGPKDAGEAILKRIVSAPLTSVNFVLDYLILGFDSKGALTALVWPKVVTRESSYGFGEPGYRDALCGFLGRKVGDVSISEEETITITFESGEALEIALRDRNDGGERAIFIAPNRVLHVW